MRPRDNPHGISLTPLMRIRIWYALLVLLAVLFVIRLFYLQVIRHDYYQKAAISTQLKEYELPATRGIIEAHSGDTLVPIVLNETKYTLFADPKFVKDPAAASKAVQGVIGGNANDYETKMKSNGRYVVLAKKLSKEQNDKLVALKLKGIGTRESDYRTYPQGSLAAQLLGFVDDDGHGKYGIEQALNSELTGTPGLLKAITDAQGVPLATNKENILNDAQSGKRVVLTVDLGMQQQLEDILKTGLDHAISKSGSALIIDAQTGAVKAMANYPTYNPSEFFKVEDASVFTNPTVSDALEVGSTMKPLTAAAAIDQGVITKNTTFFDPGQYKLDGATVTDVEEDGGAARRSVADILQLSLNTGATWLLMQMGGGQINQKARETWHDYMVNHYQFGKATGIEQGYEGSGTVPDPNNGYGLNIQYANTAFGQGMSATPLQMAAALGSVVNGGTYYRPHLVDRLIDSNGKETVQQPEVARTNVVSAGAGRDIKELMEYTVTKNYTIYGMKSPMSDYGVGGKTGTAQIAKPGGGYYENKFNGLFIGFVGGDEAEYIIVVKVNEPGISGFAGARSAAPIFGGAAEMLINNFGVPKKTN